MSQGLHLSQRLAQQMVLSPQLQQSLALLQAPVLELKAMVEAEMQQNPVLEEAAPNEASGSDETPAASLDPAEPPPDTQVDPTSERSDGPVDKLDAELQRILQLDQEWSDHFAAGGGGPKATSEDEERRQFMFDTLTADTSLQSELLDQARMAELSDRARQVAELIIGNIDERGYLQSTIQELAFSTGIPAEELEAALTVIQTFHPPGVGARDLRECLMLQLERENRVESLEYKVLRDHFETLAKRRFPELARKLGISALDAQEVAESIARLDPGPGRVYGSDDSRFVAPEVFVTKSDDGEYVVTVNDENLPRLRISNQYKDLLSRTDTASEDREYIREKIKAAKFLIKSIHQRQGTIQSIAKEIVKRQKDFFDRGVTHLVPMTMAQVAEVVGVHETTVSRAVSGKYMDTPQGLFEMKYFFTSGLATSEGGTMSNTSVKTILQELIGGENTHHPLSDEDLVEQLKQRGIQIARRTVAKYRAELKVLPSHLRKAY
jgi:RNA polymerase sigma-54 factor